MTTDVLIVFGTRPEGIKMAPVIEKLKKYKSLNIKTIVTGQHREMLDQILELFDIKVDYDLAIMKPGQDLFDVTSEILVGMRDLLKRIKPRLVLVHGDTTTSMVTALACFYLGISVGHVEAGLRTNDLKSPFPEELNRKINGLLSSIHFAPTLVARDNLIKEGIAPSNIKVTGNTVVDALQLMDAKLKNDVIFYEKVKYKLMDELKFDYTEEKYILITGHRRENFGKGFEDICQAIRNLAHIFPKLKIIYPVHLNPNVKNTVMQKLSKIDNIYLIQPQSYECFTSLLSYSHFILTDSGGIQEEAPSLGKPVLVMRDTTERPEAVEAGTVALVGTDPNKIFDLSYELLTSDIKYNKMATAINPYGDGNASKYITENIMKFLQERTIV